MKKSLVALAALAVAGVASAQSSVTLFGVVDAAISSYSNKSETPFNSITTSATKLTNSGYNSSRLGFRGTEDLGGGLAASFWLEAALGNDDGTAGAGLNNFTTGSNQFFNRRSTVSLSGAFGEVRLGRDYVPTFWNDTVFDPFGTNGVGTNLIMKASGFSSQGALTSGFGANPNQVRANNSIGYFLPPNLGGFYGQLMYAFNEKTSYDPGQLTPPTAAGWVAGLPATATATDPAGVSRSPRYIGGRVGYANGPLDVALAYGESTLSSNYFTGTTTNLDILNLGASWDFGVAKLFGEYSKNDLKQDVSTGFIQGVINPFGFREPGADGWLLGVTVPVGPGLIRASYSRVDYKNTSHINQLTGLFSDPKADQWALGYVHNLSKRTALYASVARISNKDGADLNVGGPAFFTTPITANGVTAVPQATTSIGYDFGIRHAF
ncbi:MAG: porin [Variovorax sp.]|nr:porin [Variovorax sp.]